MTKGDRKLDKQVRSSGRRHLARSSRGADMACGKCDAGSSVMTGLGQTCGSSGHQDDRVKSRGLANGLVRLC